MIMEKTVFFRAFEDEDAPLLYEWMNDDGLRQLSVGLNKRVCKEEVLDWIKARKCHNPFQAWFAICAKDTNEMIGYMSLTDIHYINSSVNFSGIMIGNQSYRDGQAYIESYLFGFEYAFERLNLNRLYGSAMSCHKLTVTMAEVMFQKTEGVLRQAVYKDGHYYDELVCGILRNEYYEHKNNGDYEMPAILKRILQIKKRGS